MTRCTLAVCLVSLALALSPIAAHTEPDTTALARARATAVAGDRTTSIRLYDELLRASPDDVTLLVESAQQLSWNSQYEAAVHRYEQALSIEPGNRFAARERAKVLSWSGRYPDAVDAFRGLVAQDPEDVEARLGLARTLSWSGRQQEARAEYESVLAAGNRVGEARLGLAQTWAWSGQLDEARALYEQARPDLPDTKDADLGLAYVDFWQGRLRPAHAAAAQLAQRYPGDRDVAALQRELNRATAPRITASWDQLDDSDGNLLTVSRLEGSARPPIGASVGLAYANYGMSSAGQRGSIDSLQATASWSPRWRHTLDAMAGLDRLSPPTAGGRSVLDWGLTYSFPAGSHASGWIGVRREPYRYSVPLITNEIVIDSLNAGLRGDIGDHWSLATGASAWDTSDGNRRRAFDFAGTYRFRPGSHTIEVGGVTRWLDWRDDLENGYFDPSNFRSLGVTGRAHGPLLRTQGLDYDLSMEVGAQSYETADATTRGDPYYLVVGKVGWQFAEAGRLEAFAEAGTYASQGAGDWRYTRAGIRFSWNFGSEARR